MENFICNQYGEMFTILNIQNIKMCLHFPLLSAEHLTIMTDHNDLWLSQQPSMYVMIQLSK